jgi:hypothetical protein
MDVAAMWVSIAAVVIMIGWFRSKNEAQKHQTFRTIVEKTGAVDEAQLKLLFDTRPPPLDGAPRIRPGRWVLAAIAMFVAICLLIVLGWTVLSMFELTPNLPLAGALWSVLVCVLGVGFFWFSARLANRASAESERRRVGSLAE